MHGGRGTLVERTGVGPYSGKNQNWGFWGISCNSLFRMLLWRHICRYILTEEVRRGWNVFLTTEPPRGCKSVGDILYSGLSHAFSILNIMCYHMCWIHLFRINLGNDDVMTSHTLTYSHTWISTSVLEMGLIFRVILLLIRGEPLSKFSLKCVFWPPLSNEGSDRCSGVFVFEIFAFKVFKFIHEHFASFSTFWSFIIKNRNTNLSDHYQHSYLVKRLAFVFCLLH